MQTTIARLKKDYQNVVEELIAKDQTMQRNKSDVQKLLSDEEDTNKYKSRMGEEEQKQGKLDKDILAFQEMLLKEKEKLGGINATHEGYMHIQKQIRILENRLDKANQKFNDAMSHNNKLKSQIDSLRKESQIFEVIYKRLEGELRKKREEMAQKIEEANKAYEQRDKLQEETNRLTQENAKCKENVDKKMEELKNEFHKENQMTLLQSRKLDEKGDLERLGSQIKVEDENVRTRGEESLGAWGVATKATGQDIAKEYAAYRQAFAQIEAATKITRIEELVEKFEKAEQENFELFKFVNQLCAEIEKLEVQIKEMQKQIQLYEGQELNQEKTSEKLRRDEEELAKIEQKAESYESKHQKATKTLNSMKAMIENIFTSLECFRNVSPELLGAHGVTESNMMAYIGAVEQRREELFQACREYVEKKRELGEPFDVDPIILDLVDSNGNQKETGETQAEKVSNKEIDELYMNIPGNEFEVDADIPNLNEMSKRLENYVHRGRPESAFINPKNKLL
jgi:chromosome segregation ATPase